MSVGCCRVATVVNRDTKNSVFHAATGQTGRTNCWLTKHTVAQPLMETYLHRAYAGLDAQVEPRRYRHRTAASSTSQR